MGQAYFTPELFAFFDGLAANNDRDWFNANKARYETAVRAPFMRFISDLQPHLDRISPHLVVDPRPNGGSMFRIHRDTRFSKDKTPYKTWAAVFFPVGRSRTEGAAPGFFFSLGHGRGGAGAGVWRPDPASLAKIRDAIASDPEGWKKATMGLEIAGERLTRAPKGYDPAHPLIEDLKLKDFVTRVEITPEAACADDLLERYVALCRKTAPLGGFLAKALDLPW